MKAEEYENITLGTKVTPKELAALKEIIKELGFKTPYELLKFVVAALVRIADTWHSPDEECEPALAEFFRLFQEIDDKDGLTSSFDVSHPEVIIGVYKGGHIVTFRRNVIDEMEIEETQNVNETITELHKLTHPTAHALLCKVARAYGLKSVPKVVEQLAMDAAQEIEEPDDESLGYTMNEYGTVPKRTRTKQTPL